MFAHPIKHSMTSSKVTMPTVMYSSLCNKVCCVRLRNTNRKMQRANLNFRICFLYATGNINKSKQTIKREKPNLKHARLVGVGVDAIFAHNIVRGSVRL